MLWPKIREAIIGALYANAHKALKPGGRLLVHDFMVNDSLDGPPLGALWALQHVTVNADGLGLCPREVIGRMASAGFDAAMLQRSASAPPTRRHPRHRRSARG